jgi:metal-responsive CopG/Arc/MetJ family transcriptional regulator
MKTAISIPDDLYAEAEVRARRLRRSRSRLYADAMREYLARHDSDSVTATLNRLADLPDSRLDAAMTAASVRILERAEW